MLDTYASEREMAIAENIVHFTHATNLITPKSAVSRLVRGLTTGAAQPGTVRVPF